VPWGTDGQLSLEKDGTRDLALTAHKPTYTASPHRTALPSEADVTKILAGGPVRCHALRTPPPSPPVRPRPDARFLGRQLSVDALLARLQRERGAKIGMRAHVEELVRRKCVVDADGHLVWRTASPKL
jgi:hypothetical protein